MITNVVVGVCGFGVFGGGEWLAVYRFIDPSVEIPTSAFQYFKGAFDLLKWNNMNIVCNAGITE